MVNYRQEIDGLRALAVLAVVLNHSGVKIAGGGHLGVDVFFVISGYVITAGLLRSFETGSFKYTEFLKRRIRRILPAATTVITVTTIAVFLVYRDAQRDAALRAALSALTFQSNFFFRGTTDYFAPSAQYQPFLHMWSLSLEEQFYLLYPLLFIGLSGIAMRRFRLISFLVLMLVAFSSLTAAIFETQFNDRFYLLQFRSWELIAGGLLAYVGKYGIISETSKSWKASVGTEILSYLAFISLIVVLVIPSDSWWRGGFVAVVIAVAATVVLIGVLPSARTLKALLTNRIFVLVGLASYSIYLWHQPIVALVGYRMIGSFGLGTQIVLVVSSVLLGIVSWRIVEQPVRDVAKWSFRQVGFSLLTATCVLLAGLYGIRSALNQDSVEESRSQETQTRGSLDSFVLVGDSHAAHLVPGLDDYFGKDIRTLTSNGCIPLLNVDRWDSRFTPGDCAEVMTAGLEEIMANGKVEVVALASMGPVYLTGQSFRGLDQARTTGDGVVLRNRPEIRDRWKVFQIGLEETFKAMQRAGKDTIFILDVPELGIAPHHCSAGNEARCRNSRSEIDLRNERYRSIVFDVVRRFPAVLIFDPIEIFCDVNFCHGLSEGQPLYVDGDHLTDSGSAMVAQELGPVIEQLLSK